MDILEYEMMAYQDGYDDCAEIKDLIIKQQAAEIAALREQLKLLRQYANSVITQQSQYHARLYKLLDENGNPTPLLTGEASE